MNSRLVALVCFGALALGACSSSGGGGENKAGARIDTKPTLPAPGNGSQGSAKACSIVTEANATKLFGTKAAQAPDVTGGTGATSTCVWKAGDANNEHLLQVRVYPNTNYYDGAKALGGSSVKGLGDKAIVRSAGTLLTLTFVQDGQTVAMSYSITGSDAQKKPESQTKTVESIGKQAAARL